MTHEFLTIGQDSGPGFDALPGIRTVFGTGFNSSFLQQAFGYQAENSTNIGNWFPFDRGIQVPTPLYWDNGTSAQYGLYYWVQNQILRLNGTTDNWVDILTIADMQDINDFSIHTGLYEVYGSDGKLYVCGMYPGAANASSMGAVVFDTETETWTDKGERNVGGRISNCQYCIAWNERLWLASENGLYSYDPVSDTLERETIPGDGRPDQKVLILGQRFFVCVESAARLRIYEKLAGTWTEMADLGQITHNAGAMFDYALTNTQAIFFFNSVETISGTPMSGLRAVEVTTVDPEPGGPLFIDEVTTPVLDGFPQIFSDALNTHPDVRVFTASDGSAFPDQFPQINIWFQFTTGFNEAWGTHRWVDKSSQLGVLPPASGGGVAYVSCKEGAGGRIYSSPTLPTTQRKVVVYKVEAADQVTEDGLLVSFWAFGDPATGQVRIRRGHPVSPVAANIRENRGTIFAVLSGGTLFNFTQINNVPINKVGGGVHQFVWDRNTDAYRPWLVYTLSVELSDD